jgi:hypothetical protein
MQLSFVVTEFDVESLLFPTSSILLVIWHAATGEVNVLSLADQPKQQSLYLTRSSTLTRLCRLRRFDRTWGSRYGL